MLLLNQIQKFLQILTIYDYETLKVRIRELAFLNKGLKLILIDDSRSMKILQKKNFLYEGGISEYVKYLK